MSDIIPVPLRFPEINLANHIACIQHAALGPADPRQPSTQYWNDKMDKWKVAEGVARTRLCMNCAHYDNSPEVLAVIPSSPGGQMKPSQLPVTPKWADIDSMPQAICSLWSITCSALRTCDDWEDPNKDPDNRNVWFITPTEEIDE